MKRFVILVAAGVALSACGEGVSGTYVGGDDAFLDKLDFKSDEVVEISAMGATTQGTYKVEDDKVVITVGGEAPQVFEIGDGGCLDAGGIIGKYCKE